MKAVTTLSGTIYEFEDGKVRRTGHDMRGDGKWLELLREPVIAKGESMLLFLEPLGTEAMEFTARRTSPVTEIQEDK